MVSEVSYCEGRVADMAPKGDKSRRLVVWQRLRAANACFSQYEYLAGFFEDRHEAVGAVGIVV